MVAVTVIHMRPYGPYVGHAEALPLRLQPECIKV